MALSFLEPFSSRWTELTSFFNPSKDLLDLTGKVAIVTGGNKGIGYWTVFHLRSRGAKVYLCARDEGKARAAIEAMQMNAGSKSKDMGEVIFLHLDLEDPRGVHNAALSILENEERLDIIVNNAAIGVEEYQETEEGISKHMVVNHISHSLLVKTLSPLLVTTARREKSDVRVITLTSIAHIFISGPDIKFNSLEAFNLRFPEKTVFDSGMKLYGHSKLANILMSKELQRHYDALSIPITCIAVHPGYIGTEGAFDSFRTLPSQFFVQTFLKIKCISPEKGSYTSLFAAASPKVKSNPSKYRGAYLTPFDKVTQSAPLGDDVQLAKNLWETTERILKEKYEL